MEPVIWIWLGIFVVFLIFEIATTSLTTIWFAGGSLVALILACVGVPLIVQIIAFIVISVILLIFTRPVLKRIFKSGMTKTNVESLIGKTAKVTERIYNIENAGTAVINGQEWTARAEKDEDTFEPGDMAEIIRISGVKLILRK